MQVSKAVINGAKLAYPNGVKLKYENVSLTLSVGDGANTNTAPQGKICKIIVIIGNISNLIFFIVSTPPKKFRFLYLIIKYLSAIYNVYRKVITQWVHNSEKGVEKLEGNRSGQYSIRINDQYRICFRVDGHNFYDVEIVDYH